MKTKKMKRLCVYCGSGSGIDPRFKEAAATLGRSIAEAGIGLVYGGGGNGLMGTVAQTTHDYGGHVTGIIPASLLEIEIPESGFITIPMSHLTSGAFLFFFFFLFVFIFHLTLVRMTLICMYVAVSFSIVHMNARN